MNEDEKIVQIMTRLLEISNTYLDCYCEIYDEYVLSDKEIEEIEDEDERERAKDLKETDDFLKKAATFIEEYKKSINKENVEIEEEEEL